MNPAPSRIAAFFDLDGTLVPFPSLERRLVRALLYRHAIPASNFALWPLEMARLSPRGLAYARQANKMHLRGISADRAAALARQLAAPPHLPFFSPALDRIAWHASQGHHLVLITGTPQVLARCAVQALEAELVRRGIATTILVRATTLEEISGRWTGRITGEPMFGRSKAAAVRALASLLELDLHASFAYGDSIHDRPMLDIVGRPFAVNPSRPLRRFAQRNGWPINEWRLASAATSVHTNSDLHFTKRKVETLG